MKNFLNEAKGKYRNFSTETQSDNKSIISNPDIKLTMIEVYESLGTTREKSLNLMSELEK